MLRVVPRLKATTIFKVRRAALVAGYRSGLEVQIAAQLKAAGIDADYEKLKVPYTVPESLHKYTPDWKLPNGIIIESKGRFVTADRKKHILLKEQHPTMDLRFVFSRSKTPISKGSKTTYADWCDKNGFKYADKLIPPEWLTERPK